MLHGEGKRGLPWRTALLISASLDSLEVGFINVLFCAYTSADVLCNVPGMFRNLKYHTSNMSLCTIKCFIIIRKSHVFPNYIPFVFQLII